MGSDSVNRRECLFRGYFGGWTAAAFVASALLLSACAPSVTPEGGGPEPGSVGATVITSDDRVNEPQAAVAAYQSAITRAYMVLDSDIASLACTPEELVRVDSYIELNRQRGRAIQQVLESAEVLSASEDASRAVVAARESWSYRYVPIADPRAAGATLTVSYETTYTLVDDADRGWVVARVQADPIGPAPR